MSSVEFLFDETDRELVARYKWFLDRRYLRTCVKVAGKWKNVCMHTLLLKPPTGMVVDHINGNTLDNRRANLRIATPSQNAQNRKRRPGKNKYLGVWPHHNGFVAALRLNYKIIRRYGFRSAEDAARVRDRMAKKYHGEFAVLNFPEEL